MEVAGSDDEYVWAPNGAGSNGRVDYSVVANSDTTVTLRAEVETPSPGDDSFYVWFDGSDDDNTNFWHVGTHTSFSWRTVTVGRNQQPITFDLSNGTHVLHIGVREDGAKLKTVQIIGDAVLSAMPCLRLAASRVCLDLGQLWSDPSVSIVVQVGLEQLGGWAQILRALLEPCGSGFSKSV